jgi:hypothetical protein
MERSLYYLRGDTDREMHDDACCCGDQSQLPHRAIGASLYRLDGPGLLALNALLMGEDEESFWDWCNGEESQGTHYGLNEAAAIEEALHQAQRDGWLVVNCPERYPGVAPLVDILRGVVGVGGDESDGYLGQEVCECDNTHEQNQSVCRVCYARLACNILWSSLYPRAERAA